MAIFGSFIGKDRSLFGESIIITILDTFVALTAGLIIFPACFTYDVDVSAGPPLIFQTLPNIFANMPGGRIWGSLFFLFLTFAAFSTILAVFQNIISCVQELTGWTKRKTCLICGIAMFILSIPCILGFNVWSDYTFLGGVLDTEDFIVSYILLPLGSLAVVLFCTSKYGWGFENFMAEANQGSGAKVKKWMYYYCKYVLPVIIIVLFVYGILDKFGVIKLIFS
jgi:NSS family neurotransmitter:Na+ symporter